MAGASFYESLAAAINRQVAAAYGVSIALVQYPAQGDFLWWYQSPQGYFNEGTFNYLSARVSPAARGAARLSAAGGFPNAYIQLLSQVGYGFSSADQTRIQSSRTQAAAQAMTLVSDYQTAFGQITPAQMQTAAAACGAVAVQTLEDYVLAYVLGYQWSGSQASHLPPLRYDEMAAAPNLRALLPATPATGAAVVSDAAAYLAILNAVAALQGQAQLAAWTLARLSANTAAPSIGSGGMTTVNPSNGSVSPTPQVGYAVGRSIADIQNDLTNPSRVWTIQIPAPAISAPAVAVESPGSLAAVLRDAGNPDSLTISYAGYTLVPIAPADWQPGSGAGWFAADPIRQAFANQGKDATGYRFLVNPAFNLASFASGGNFGRITSLLLSNYPQVIANYTRPNAAALRFAVPADPVLGLRLMGALQLGRPYTASIDSTDDATVRLALAPLPVPVPTMQQSAFVIGATIDTPAAP